jgi:hypothetical protein
MIVDAELSLTLKSTYRRARALGVVSYLVDWAVAANLLTGTGANQADTMYAARRTIAAGANDDINLASGLTDPFNNPIVFVEVRGLAVRAPTTNTGVIRVGGAAPANRLTGLWADSAGYVDLAPGMIVIIPAPADNDVVVVNGASNILRLNNQAASSGFADVVIFGTSV